MSNNDEGGPLVALFVIIVGLGLAALPYVLFAAMIAFFLRGCGVH